MANNTNKAPLTPQEIITAWKLNKEHLAARMGVNAYTFRMKMAGKPNYHFTASEIKALNDTLKDLAGDIANLD